MVERIRLGELLVKAGVLNDFQLRSALKVQRQTGIRLGRILVNFGYLEEDLLLETLSEQLRIPLAKLEPTNLPVDVLERIDTDDAFARNYCPERFERGVLTVAMSDPTDLETVEDIAFRTGWRVRLCLASENQVRSRLRWLLFDTCKDPMTDFPAGADTGPFAEVDPCPVVSAERAAAPMRECAQRSVSTVPPVVPCEGEVFESQTVTPVGRFTWSSQSGDKDESRVGKGVRQSSFSQDRFGPLPSSSEDRFGPLPSSSEDRIGPLPPSSQDRCGRQPSSSEKGIGPLPSSSSKQCGRGSTVHIESGEGWSHPEDYVTRTPSMITLRGFLAEPSPPPELIEVPEYSNEELVKPKSSPKPSAPETISELNLIATKLQAAQKRQNRAIRVMIDMLIESGVFTEEEFRSRLGLHRLRSRNRR
ncbi:MAG: hypothetical protein KTR25_10035 [Myxococcales bacterium]|nr:hypothetical protein [Myxococcales bacterium]